MNFSFNSGEIASIVILFASNNNENLELSIPARKFDEKSGNKISNACDAYDYKGALNSLLTIPAPIAGVKTCILVGLGEISKIEGAVVERAIATAVKSVSNQGASDIAILFDGMEIDAKFAAHAMMGAKLALYRFDKYRTKLKPAQALKIEKINIDMPQSQNEFNSLSAIADGVYLARDLMNEPPNVLTTTEFANRLKELETLGVQVEIIDESQMADLKMFSYLGVGQGSVNPPKMVIMKYLNGGKDEAPLTFVGKGLCFDSGGLSLKPAGGMEDMKGDMGGAAAVAGAMKAIAGRKAKTNVIGLVGLAENMPDAGAQRPGDIVTSMSGQTIEVLNTDAEGRLVLCDVLTYAQRTFKPKYVVDLATLTGAIVISLGAEYAGLFSNSDDLSLKITNSGNATQEKVWRFPLAPAYDKLLDSNIADMKNVQRSGPGAGAGSITAAQFLQRFIEGETQWAHIDIAGTAWQSGGDDPRSPSWGTGFGVRLLDNLVKENFEN